MSVGNLHKQRDPVQLYFVYQFRKTAAKPFCKKNDANLFIGHNLIKFLLKLIFSMNDTALDTCQAHASPGIDVVAD